MTENNLPLSKEEYEAQISQMERELKKQARQIKNMEMLHARLKSIQVAKNNLNEIITDEQRKQERYMQLLLSNSPDIILMFDAQGRMVYCTDTFLKTMNVPNFSQLNGRLIREIFVAKEYEGTVERAISAFAKLSETNEPVTLDEHIGLGQGEQRNYSIHIAPLTDGDGVFEGAIAMFHDYTEIAAVRDQAKAANRAKSDFLAKMSHEIRTPMNAIVGMCELILRENLPQSVYGHAVGIKQASANLLSIINDILDVSKIESGKLEIICADYQLASVINEISNMTRMRLMDKPINFLAQIDANIPSVLHGDEVRVRQIIMNLLSNAVKYTAEGYVEFSISSEPMDDGRIMLTIRVCDSGMGIREEDIERMFGDFVQINTAATRGIEGTGLGLTITKSLCAAMGGSIRVESEYGVGSTFTVCIPQTVTSRKPIASVREPEKKNVLLYEMREKCGKSVLRAFENLGVSCTLADMQSKFYQAFLETSTPFTHIFLPQMLLDSATKVVEKLEVNIKMIAMADYASEVVRQDIETVPTPIHTIAVADILNGQKETSEDKAKTPSKQPHFIAPSAHILLVDDIATNLAVAEGLMAPYEMQIDACKSGEAAIESVMQNRYDIIFMDHMMPGMDGIEATMRIREMAENDSYFADVPIIALTANAISGMREMFLANGMNDYLAKPIDIPSMDALLDRWIPPAKKAQKPDTAKAGSAELILIDGLDTKLGLTMTGGVMDYYIKVLKNYLADGHHKLRELQETFSRQDFPLYATYVHALKSASASIGAQSIAQRAKDLEFAAKNENITFVASNNAKLLEALSKTLSSIGVALEEYAQKNGGKEPTFGADDLKKRLKSLKAALDEFDSAAIDATVSELTHGKWEKCDMAMLEQMFEHIMLADYDEAIEIIDAMLDELEKH